MAELKRIGNIFNDRSVEPTDQMLSQVLGTSFNLWTEIKNSLNKEYGELTEEWKYYGQKIGWQIKLFYKKKNLFFFTPCDNYFRIGFVFGDKAVSAIEQSDLPQHIIEELRTAKKYSEGRGIKIEVKNKKDIMYILKLVHFKIIK